MCKQCLEAVERHYPGLNGQQTRDLLWSATPFPMGGPEHVEAALIDAKENSDGTVSGAIQYANEELDRAMREIAEKEA